MKINKEKLGKQYPYLDFKAIVARFLNNNNSK